MDVKRGTLMAQKVLVQLVDDLDGTSSDDISTVTFGLDGVTYEIDLTEKNATILRQRLADFLGAARRTGGRAQRGKALTATSAGRSREQNEAVREWAKTNNWEISDRGRIPSEIIEAFEAQAGKKGRKAK
jgi:Lsr2